MKLLKRMVLGLILVSMAPLYSMQVISRMPRRATQIASATIKPQYTPRTAMRFAAKQPKDYTFIKTVGSMVLSVTAGLCMGELYSSYKKSKQPKTELQKEDELWQKLVQEASQKSEKEIYRDCLLGKPWKNTVKKHLEQLDKEEEEYTKKFLALTGLSKEEFELQALILSYAAQGQSVSILKEFPAASDATTSRVKAIASSIGIDPDSIIVLNDKNIFSGASFGPILKLNENYCKNLSHYLFLSMVLHELAHRVCDSDYSILIRSRLDELMVQSKKEANHTQFKKAENFFQEYHHFIEKRADIYSALVDYDGSLAASIEFEENGQRQSDGYDAGLSHPSNFDRSDYLEELYDEMLEEVIQNQTHII